MKLSLFVLFAFICILKTQADQVSLTLFYESLCPGCRNFITTQIYPTYQKMTDYISLDLVPFGKANFTQENGQWSFTCQHGPNECIGNKYQSCALAYGADINFVNCIEHSGDPSSADNIETCCDQANISWKDIKNCYDSGEGDTLLIKNGNRTKSMDPPLQFVPTTLFNGVFNQTLIDDAFENLAQVVCSLLKDKPASCSS